ncbi:MAG: hypothetical protein K0R18_522 [Bacillales bacterium]|jgi:hypothetical protein|nr:hypothetical protein [Bacillales bacterium]
MKTFVYPDDVKINAVQTAKEMVPKIKDALIMSYLTRDGLKITHNANSAQIYIYDKFGILAVVYTYVSNSYAFNIRHDIGEFDNNDRDHFLKEPIFVNTQEELLALIAERLV